MTQKVVRWTKVGVVAGSDKVKYTEDRQGKCIEESPQLTQDNEEEDRQTDLWRKVRINMQIHKWGKHATNDKDQCIGCNQENKS